MNKTKIQALLKDIKADAALITDPANMRYLTGFCGEGYVLLEKKKVSVITDSRYTIAAKNECPDCEVIEWDKIGIYKTAMQLSKRADIKKIGFEDTYMRVSAYKTWEKKLRDVKLVPIGDKVTKLRQVKSGEEIKKIAAAEAIGDRAFARLLLDLGVEADKLGEVGKEVEKYHIPTYIKATESTEKQIAAKLEFYMKDEGAEGLSFETIAASGLNGAMPHAVPQDKYLEKGELLTLDFGCIFKGYCSDMTRTIAIGEPDAKLLEIYNTVKKAQKFALDNLRAGMTGLEIDKLARDIIEEAGYGKNFGHSLGHSVGLEIHERPGFSRKEKTVIEAGMVVSVEPGIYVEGVGGVRIEDLVAVTESGANNLAKSVKELIVV
ncbi:MAG: Xaa-Pro peptidase family protein [Eubacterium sp.]|nr:Xaa-Pro peptidase family protein [Eubacterium sp.]